MAQFDEYSFRAQPGYDEPALRAGFARAVPRMKTVVVHCYDPRAVGIPSAVARHFGDETYPGELLTDANGNKVGSTTSMVSVVVAGGRASEALRSVTVAEHLFGIERVVVVHHSFCGATSFTDEGIFNAWATEHQGADISHAYDAESVSITDFPSSLSYDVNLLRAAPGVPRDVAIYGLFYNLDSGEMTEVVRDIPTRPAEASSLPARP